MGYFKTCIYKLLENIDKNIFTLQSVMISAYLQDIYDIEREINNAI